MVNALADKMRITTLGYRVIDEDSGIAFELVPKTKEGTQELITKFFDNFQILKVETQKALPLKKEKKPSRKPRSERSKPEEKSIPTPAYRLVRELTDLPEEFIFGDIGDLFEKDGYDRKKIMRNAYHDINDLLEKNRIYYIDGTKPKKYGIISRDTSDLG